MRLGRLIIIFALVLIVVMVIVYAMTGGLGGGGEAEATPIATDQVVVLAQAVRRGDLIQEAMLTYFVFPSDQIPENMFTDPLAVVGFIARFDMEAGTLLTDSMLLEDPSSLVNANLGSPHSLLIPEGMVAFPIPVTRFTSLGFGLTQGDRVNVIVTMTFVDIDSQFQSILPNYTAGVVTNEISSLFAAGDVSLIPLITTSPLSAVNVVSQTVSGGPASQQGRGYYDSDLNLPFYLSPSESQRPRLVSVALLQNVVVLHVGNFTLLNDQGEEVVIATPVPAGGDQQEYGNEENPVVVVEEVEEPDIITLIVTPQDAVTLNYLLYAGAELTLALRPSTDDTIIDIQPVTLNYLMDHYQIPLPSHEAYGMAPRLDDLETPLLYQDLLEDFQFAP